MILKNLIDPDAHHQCAAAWVEATGWRAQRATHTVFAVSRERVVSKQSIHGVESQWLASFDADAPGRPAELDVLKLTAVGAASISSARKEP